MKFEDWRTQVSNIIKDITGGLTIDDIPDQPYWDWWDSGIRPYEASIQALVDAGFPEYVFKD